MAQIETVDWPGKVLYLHADTATSGFDVIAAHFELHALAVANAADEQHYFEAMTAEGNIPKDNADPNLATRFTPRYGRLRPGWRLVPWDGASHLLELTVEVISDDGIADQDLFDRSLLPPGIEVDIDTTYAQVEVIRPSVEVVAIPAGEVAEAVWRRARSTDTGFPGTYSATDEWVSVFEPEDVAGAVWDEPRAGHTTSGTFGATAEWAGVPPTVAALADGLLDELVSEHQLAGSLGATIQRLLDVIECDMHVTGGGTVLEVRRRSDNALLFSKTIAGGNAIDVVVEGA